MITSLRYKLEAELSPFRNSGTEKGIGQKGAFAGKQIKVIDSENKKKIARKQSSSKKKQIVRDVCLQMTNGERAVNDLQFFFKMIFR